MPSSHALQLTITMAQPALDNPVHRVLFCHELFRAIAQESTIPTLHALSLSCSGCEQSALAAMWQDLPTAHHALRIFSSYTLENGFWILSGPIVAYDLQRFRYYARFIRRLSSPFPSISGGPADIEPSVFMHLSQMTPGQPIFPLLKDLVLDVDNSHHLASITHFTSPSLEDICLHLASGALADSEFFYIPTTIRRLRLSGSFLYSDIVPNIQAARTLCLSDLSLISHENDQSHSLETLFYILPLFKELQRLELVLPQEFSFRVPVDNYNLRPISHVKLEGRPRQICEVTALFGPTEHFSVTLVDGYLPEQHAYLVNIFAKIALNSLETLESVNIHFKSGSRRGIPRHLRFPLLKCLHILLYVRCITRFSYLDQHHGHDLVDDAYIARIVDAWPGLTHFCLSSLEFDSRKDEPSQITFKGLRILSRLHYLEFLQIVIDYQQVCVPSCTSVNKFETEAQAYARNLFSRRQLPRRPRPSRSIRPSPLTYQLITLTQQVLSALKNDDLSTAALDRSKYPCASKALSDSSKSTGSSISSIRLSIDQIADKLLRIRLRSPMAVSDFNLNAHAINSITACSRILLNLELITEVVEWLSPTDLFDLALVSGNFSVAATKRLWRVLPSLLPLLHLLPGSLDCTTGVINWIPSQNFRLSDLQVFDQHSLLVHEVATAMFASRAGGPMDISSEIFERLQILRPNYILFPNLRSVSSPLSCIAPFLSRQLRVLLLGVDESINRDDHFLSNLLHCSPRITNITLIGPITSIFLSELRCFQGLERLHMQFPARQVFGDELATQKQAFQTLLDTLPQLTSLTALSLAFPIASEGTFPLLTVAACKNIRNIHFNGPSSEIERQLSVFHNSEEIILEFNDATTKTQANIQACCQQLARTSTYIHTVYIKSSSPLSVWPCVSVLSSVPSMRYFAIDGSNQHKLHDPDISQMVQSWPLLEQLSFVGNAQDLGDSSLLSLGRLQHLRYLRLQDIHIPLKQLPDPCDFDGWCKYNSLSRFFSPSQLLGSAVSQSRAALRTYKVLM